jgi:Zn-dependent protease with chaperone function
MQRHISPQEDALNSSGPARRGWYRVPGEPGRLRWWDGARWTDDEFVLPGSEAESVDHHPTRRAQPERRGGAGGTAPDRVRALDGRAGRRPDSSALAVLVPTAALLPVSLVALAAFWLVVRLVAPVPYWAFAVGYLAAGILMFLRPVQRLLLSWLYGARRPTPEELDRLEPAWHDVLEQAGLPAHRFVLAVTDSPELNAYACGGHVVAVSTGALELLPDDELHGVLAHELGHHLGLHTVALTITHWLSLPIITLARVGFLLERLAYAASDALAPRSAGLALIGRIVSAILQLLALAFLATVLVARRIGDRLGRSAEFAADQRAIDMGYGRHLALALRRVHALDRQDGGDGRPRAIGSHPSPMLRSARIEARLRTERA